MKPVDVSCDACGATMPAELKEDPLSEGGAIQSMMCPSCATVYPVVKITPHGLELREQLEAARVAGDQAAARTLLTAYRAQTTKLTGPSG